MVFTEILVVLLANSLNEHTAGGSSEEAALDSSYRSEEDACSSPWFIRNSTSPDHACQCGSELGGMVRCNDQDHNKEIGIMNCYCMTTDDQYGILAGPCFFSCLKTDYKLYYSLPLNTSELNKAMCEKGFERAGRLCGNCKDGYQFPAYSFSIKCTNCSASGARSWATYFCMAFIPLTLFLILLLILHVNITSPKMTTYIFLAQVLTTSTNVRIIHFILKARPDYLYLSKVVVALYGVWNLDFFRSFSPPICLNISTVQVLALDYAIAVYPLILVVLTYMLIQLHARGCRLLNILWLPFKKCYNRLWHTVGDARTSTVEVFASFLVLSYTKLLSTSFDLLLPTVAYNVRGEKVGLFLYYDASLEYFGRQHLPYGIVALAVSFFFLILPVVLLLLYPLRCFQRLFGSWQALKIFTDSFQGCYKNGVVEGKYDCRYFSAMFFVARIVLFLTYAFNQSTYFYAVSVVVLLLMIVINVVARPYRKVLSYCVILDIVFLSMLALWHASLVCVSVASQLPSHARLLLSMILAAIVGVMPLLYVPVLIIKRLWSFPSKSIKRLMFSWSQRSSTHLLPDLDIADFASKRNGDKHGLQTQERKYNSIK